MPRKTTTTTKTTQTDDEAKSAFADILDRARAVFDPNDNRLLMTIYTYGRHGEQGYLESFPYDPDVHTLDWVRQQYGPGRYQLRFHPTHIDGEYNKNRKDAFSQVVKIERLPDDGEPESKSQPASPDPILARQNQTMLEAILAQSLQQKKSGGDDSSMSQVLAAMIQSQGEMQKTLLASMINKPDNVGSFLTLAEKVSEMASNIKTDTEGGWLNTVRLLAKDLAPVLKDALQARAAMPAAPATAQSFPRQAGMLPDASNQAPPPDTGAADGYVATGPGAGFNVSAPPSAPMSSTDSSGNPQIDLGAMLRQYAPAFYEAAKSKTPAGLVSNQILDAVPAMFHEQLDSITDGDIVAAEPRLTEFSGWVGELVRYIRERGYDGDVAG